MKTYSLLIGAISLILLSGCSKNDDVSPITVMDYANLHVGNYWVYEWYEIDPLGNTTIFNKRDSIYIKKDTLIAGREYFIRTGTFLESERTTILFDSANSIYLYPSREVLFTYDFDLKYTQTYGPEDNSIAIASYSLSRDYFVIEVPAGPFACINYEGVIEPLDPDYEYGDRVNSNYYARDVGLVSMRTQFYSSPNDLEMRLVKYGTN